MRDASSTARWLALHLPHLTIDCLRRDGRTPPKAAPFVVYAKSGNTIALTAVDACAEAAGLRAGMPLADARAIRPDLASVAADPARDAAALDRIAAWCDRFTPAVAPDPPDGLFLDLSGCTHLWGGERAVLEALTGRLRAQGIAARAAIAPTPGAAWALARFGDNPIVAQDDIAAALAPLPVAALRLAPDAAALLRRLGLTTIGQIMDAPRQPFAARAGQNAMARLDQAFGRAAEALSLRRPPPPAFALRRLLEPAVTLDGVLIVAEAACGDLAAALERRGMGAKRLQLSLFGVDGRTRAIAFGLSRPMRATGPILRLLRERLAAAPDSLAGEFGFEAVRLDALEIAPIAYRAADLNAASGRDPHAEALLVDMLAARLGRARVGYLAIRDAHAPERANGWSPTPAQTAAAAAPDDGAPRRPVHLFKRAQPIEALAGVPDGPPLRFRWRRTVRKVARAEGPERIAPHWLKAPDARTRDYYRVEDDAGRRYWLYREGFFDESAPPRWFVHGLFG
jgi:protein ImuB